MYVMLRQTAEYKINSKNILQHFVKLEATQHSHRYRYVWNFYF